MAEGDTVANTGNTGNSSGGGGSAGGPSQAAPWYGQVDADTATYITSRGLDKVDAKDAFLATVKAHQEATKALRYPANEVVRYKPDDAAVMNDFYARQGVPKDQTGYTYDGLKLPDGSDLDQAFVDTIRKTSFDNHLTPAQSKAVAESIIRFVDQQDKAELTEITASVNAEREALKTTWGKDYNSNLLYAQEGAKMAFAGDSAKAAEAVNALEKVAGYSTVMELFRKVGVSLREPGPVGNSQPSTFGTQTLNRDQAQTRKTELMSDAAWVKRWYANGQNGPEAKEMQRLDRILVGASA